MAAKMPPCDVADAFVKQYYMILCKYPENAHKFYAESSLLGWPESDGVITPVTTLSAINDKILSSNYKNCFAEVNTVDAQASHDGGVFVAVTGSFLGKDEVATIFFQTFFLARQEKGFFILNDILRVLDAPTLQSDVSDISVAEDTVTKAYLSASSDASDEKVSSVVESASNANVPLVAEPTSNADASPAAASSANANLPLVVDPTSNANVSPADALATNANVSLVVEPTSNANVSPAAALDANGNIPLVVEPTSNANGFPVAPAANVNVSQAVASAAKKTVPSTVAPAAKITVPSAIALAANINVQPVAALASKEALKITYATVVAKPTSVSTPRAAQVSAQAVLVTPRPAPVTPRAAPVTPKAAPVTPKAAPVTPPKAPVPLANGAPKPSAPPLANGAPKLLPSATKATTKLTTGGNGAPDTNARPEGRGIYLGNLPYDVTKQRVAEVMRKFGPVRRQPDSVQLRKHSDGYCCAFVDFESPDSARAAVEARNVKFGEKVAYIAHKKSSYNRGSRSPTSRGYRNSNENQSDRATATDRIPRSPTRGGYRNSNENQSGRARATERGPRSPTRGGYRNSNENQSGRSRAIERGPRSPTRGGYRNSNDNQPDRARAATERSLSSGQGPR